MDHQVQIVAPIFVEKNFKHPLFNKAMQEELEKAYNWLNNQEIDKNTKTIVSVIIDNICKLNKKLLSKFSFDDKKATRGVEVPLVPKAYNAINPEIRTCRIEFIVTDKYLTDFTNIQNNLYFIYRQITELRFKYPYNCSSTDSLYYDFFKMFFSDLYTENMSYYTSILNKNEEKKQVDY